MSKKYKDRSIYSKVEKADTLVTGATGLVGRWLVPELTRQGKTVMILIRNALARADAYRAWVHDHGGDAARLLFQEYDAENPAAGLVDIDRSAIRDVYHLAARYEFGLSRDEARRVAVEGSLSLLHWCADIPDLRRFTFITGYLGLVHADAVRNTPQDKRAALLEHYYRAHGSYEASKVEENLRLVAEAERLNIPCTVINPSAIIGDSKTGETTQFIGPADMARDLYFGKLPALAGSRRTFVPLVPVDYVARFMALVPDHAETDGQSYTLLDPKTPFLPDLIRKFGEHFGVPHPTTILPKKLIAMLPRALTGVDPEILPFLSEQTYDTASAEDMARKMGLPMPGLETVLPRWLDHLISTQFGAAPNRPAGHVHDIAGTRTYVSGDVDTARILFFHGLPFDAESWSAVRRDIDIASASVDLPGLGRNGRATAAPVEWTEALLNLNHQKPVLAAQSLGCEFALRYAHAHPDRISGLVLTSPFFLQERASFALRQPWLLRLLARQMGPAKLMQTAAGRDGTPEQQVASAMASITRPGKVRHFARELSRASSPALREELTDMLRHVTVPVLLICGEHDTLSGQPQGMPVKVIAGGGHNPQLSKPEELARMIEDFAASRMMNQPEPVQALGA